MKKKIIPITVTLAAIGIAAYFLFRTYKTIKDIDFPVAGDYNETHSDYDESYENESKTK